MNKIIIFAGTIEGRKLVEYLDTQNVKMHVCVTTEYGKKLIVKSENVSISSNKLNEMEMEELFTNTNPQFVIDATHPYAAEASKNIKEACNKTNIEYIRLIRPSASTHGINLCRYFTDVESAIDYICTVNGNVLLTIGSKELHRFIRIPGYKDRIFARVLSLSQVVEESSKLGFEGRNLICMQGPFTEEINLSMIKMLNIKYLVTKDSGNAGGFSEKINAARKANIEAIIIGRPVSEEGYSYKECIKLINSRLGIRNKRRVTIAGIGMGSLSGMTREVYKACEDADVIIGAKRITGCLKEFEKQTYEAIISTDIADYINKHEEYENILVAMSGDVGFYSGAKKLIELLNKYETRVLCGISTVVYLAGRLNIPWEDIKLISTHGRECNFIGEIENNQKTFALLGGENGVKKFCETLIEYGLDNVSIIVGENLSYPEERIVRGRPGELVNMSFSPLSVLLAENQNACNKVATYGISDKEFIRDEIPMTKEEVRSISLSKLQLTRNAVIYDIGAGTGSVSIEMANLAIEGHVYAIEKNEEAVKLIEANKRHFGITNLTVIKAEAPDINNELPKPTHAFIGGSSGKLKSILNWLLDKNSKLRIVINVITLENLTETVTYLKEKDIKNADIVQVNISKNRELGRYNLMAAQNPVYIISFTGNTQM